MEINVNLKENSYKIILNRGLLNKLNDYLEKDDYIIITDDQIPLKYIETVSNKLNTNKIIVVKAGEESKSIETYESVLKQLYDLNALRDTILIALGGGVIGDLTGFVAATYMRGIKYINIPTSTLAQIDSSIGGKTGINFKQTKNMIGAFYHPQIVLIDYDVLTTLPKRHYNSGLIEALKMGLIGNKELYEACLDFNNLNIEKIIPLAITFKKEIVEKDEKESNIRKLLNLGHTFGHAFESYAGLNEIYHGEAVLLGMIKIIDNLNIKADLIKIASQINLTLNFKYDSNKIMEYIKHDKKSLNQTVTVVLVDKIGEARLENKTYIELKEILEEN